MAKLQPVGVAALRWTPPFTYSSSVPYTTLGLNKLGANTLTLSGVNAYSGRTVVTAGRLLLGVPNAITNNGPVTVAGGIYDLGGFADVTNGVVTMTSGVITNGTLYSAPFSGSGGALYIGLFGSGGFTNNSGTTILAGANTYTGPTVVAGGTLTLNRQTGSLITGTALTFGSTGTFNLDNVGASGPLTHDFGALSFSAGDGTVRTTRTAGFDELLTFTSVSRTAGAAGNFVLGGGTASAGNGFVIGGLTSNTFIDKGLFSAGTNYAWYDTGGFVRGMAYPTDTGTATSGATTSVESATHQQITGALSAQTNATFTTFKDSGNFNVTLAAGQTVTVDGILKTGNSATVTGGTGIQASSGAEMVIRNDTSGQTLTITTPILANGVNALTKSGAGTLSLGATNMFTGKTTVAAGTLTLTTPLTNSAPVGGPLGAPTGADATIDLCTGASLFLIPPQQTPRVTDRPINLIGGPGTANLQVNGNDTEFRFNGPITASGTGAKTLALFTGNSGNGDREAMTFNGAIPNVSDGSPLSLQVTFRTQTGSSSYVSLNAGGTFTGPITLLQGANVTSGFLTIGGLFFVNNPQGTVNTPGSGQLGSGNYAGNISLGTATILNYNSSANQILAGVISGAGALTKNGLGTLTLSGTESYTGGTTLSGGTLVIGGAGQLGSGSYANTISMAANTVFSYASSANQTLSGVISGAGALTMSGASTLTLSGANTYSGKTTVAAGTLRLTSVSGLGPNTDVYLTTASGKLDLPFIGVVPVNALYIHGLPQPAGYYGSATRPITGTGFLRVGAAVSIASSTALASSLNPSTLGVQVTFTATITGRGPSGTVTLMDGLATLGTATLSGGTATLATAALTFGTHSITASYSGDANNNGSPSSALSQSVNNRPPVAYNIAMGALTGQTATLRIIGGKNEPTDPDNDPLTVTAVGPAANGTVTTDGTNVTYTSANTFTGTNTFTYTVSDNRGGLATATVTVTVIANGPGFNLLSADLNGMKYAGVPGFSYALERTTFLTPLPVIWTPLVTNVASPSGALAFTNTGAGFYRTRWVP
jgi:autotransporter-associated beta strand protein